MTNTVVFQLVSAVCTALGASGAPAMVYRQRVLPLAPNLVPAMVVYPIRDVQLERAGLEDSPISDRRLTVRIECRVIPPDDLSIDTALDPLIAWATQQLAVVQPTPNPYLQHLVSGSQLTGLQWAMNTETDRVYAGVALDFALHYQTLADNSTDTP